ncbi:endonuclease/exonuclease/phosphatase family protein [Alkalilacustris brevis]|uniref:endonuclease/exonuclease/phosphatase family protein n=1 Tax=Alkalilacustris brevis TaxID=2026338 RepID=UPI000E0DA21F|nr:endonuclease/exonuclease/phosphatase family protein [Alkalilacustris brevis]
MRLATYNVEWFNALFGDDHMPIEDDGPSGRYGISRAQQLYGLGIAFTALDADAVMVIEAPDEGNGRSSVTALENFARHFGLRTRKALIGFASESQQEIALLYDPDALSVVHEPLGEPTGKHGREGAPRFDGVLRLGPDENGTEQKVVFSRPPLELLVESRAGNVFRLIGVHTKAKVPHGARDAEDAIRLAVENRRKQFAQCVWLRRRIEEHLCAGDPLIVMGDFNDGPEIDEYELLFPRSGVEVVLGWDGPRDLQLYDRNARKALSKHLAAAPSSARFLLPHGQYVSALLDYIMISPELRTRNPKWRIWHPFDDKGCFEIPELREALLLASDHFPVTLDIDL